MFIFLLISPPPPPLPLTTKQVGSSTVLEADVRVSDIQNKRIALFPADRYAGEYRWTFWLVMYPML